MAIIDFIPKISGQKLDVQKLAIYNYNNEK